MTVRYCSFLCALASLLSRKLFLLGRLPRCVVWWRSNAGAQLVRFFPRGVPHCCARQGGQAGGSCALSSRSNHSTAWLSLPSLEMRGWKFQMFCVANHQTA